jgi:hypothetical protein
MYCKYCGNKLDEQATFCSKCGKRVEEEIDAFDQPVFKNTEEEDQKSKLGSPILGFGITSMIFAFISFILSSCALSIAAIAFEGIIIYSALTVMFPILGVIFAAESRSRAKEYKMVFGETNGKATVGKNIALPALIINIVSLGLYILAILISMGLYL